jgi:thioredoxin-dependent peroxiredoxin
MTIEPGKKAPDFALLDQDDKKVSLSDFKGKWLVLYFYPKDDTPGCTIEGIEFTAHQKEFEMLGAVVLGVSGDSAKSHCDFIEKHKLGIRLLTDTEKEMMRAYGAFGSKMLYGKSFLGIIRSTVLVDPSGKVTHHWPKVKAEGHAEAVLKRLLELR